MATGKLDSTHVNYFETNISPSADDQQLHLETSGKYLDRDIYINILGSSNLDEPVITATASKDALSVETNTVTPTNPKLTIATSGSFFTQADSYGITTTKPSGTDGTAYLTVHEDHSTQTAGSADSFWKVNKSEATYTNTAGYLPEHTTEQTLFAATSLTGGDSASISIDITDNFSAHYIPVVSVSGGGGKLTATANYSDTPTVTVTPTFSGTSLSNTITVTTTEPASGTKYIKLEGASSSLSGKTTVTRGAVTYTNSAGAIAAHSGTTLSLSESSTCQPTVTIGAGTATTQYLVLTQGSIFAATKAAADSTYSSYTEISSDNVVVPSEGYLIIQKGWYETDQKISLATLVPNTANIPTSTSSPYILSGKTAYDKDGKLITGGILTYDGSYSLTTVSA